MKRPLNLKKLYGDKYKIDLDESAYAEPGGTKNPWYFQVMCRHGHIGVHSSSLLGYYCLGTQRIKKILKDHPEIKITQQGDGEAIFLFTPEQFDIITKYAGPRRRRKMSEKNKIAAAERLRKFQFTRSKTLKYGPISALEE